MRVVLLQDVPGVGMAGEVKDVADGYGRNYLIPKKLAEFATPHVLKRVEVEQRTETRRQVIAGAEVAQLANALDGVQVSLRARVGDQDRLYGAITASDIAEEIGRVTGYDVDKRKIEIEEPIRHLGEYQVAIRLSKELVPKVRVVVEGEKG